MCEEITRRQADITRLLLRHIQAPLSGDLCLRGVLPAPAAADAVRVVVGPPGAHAPDGCTAYEIPLHTGDDEALTGYDVIGLLRALGASTHIHPSDRVSVVLGMTLVRIDPATLRPAPLTRDDNALTILRTLVHPYTEEQPDPRLLGFLFLGEDRLRLYLDAQDVPGVVAADVGLFGAVTALLAALPALLTEEERATVDPADPHCSRLVDLTHW